MDPVNRMSVTDAVVERVVDYVRSSQLGPGDRIPGEHELSRILGVSRMSVREALRALAATGLIEPQAGLGTFVAKPRLLTFMVHGPLPSLLTSLEDLKEFFVARRALEPEMLSLAATKAAPDELERVRVLLTRMEKTVEIGTFDDRPWLDFHRVLFQACHNRLLIEMATPIMEMLELLFPSTVTARGKKMGRTQAQASIEVHRGMYEAVVSRENLRARQAALSHVALAERELYVALEDVDDDVTALLAMGRLDTADSRSTTPGETSA